jgi:hypothetical protein
LVGVGDAVHEEQTIASPAKWYVRKVYRHLQRVAEKHLPAVDGEHHANPLVERKYRPHDDLRVRCSKMVHEPVVAPLNSNSRAHLGHAEAHHVVGDD